jgi:hypothetical protein
MQILYDKNVFVGKKYDYKWIIKSKNCSVE